MKRSRFEQKSKKSSATPWIIAAVVVVLLVGAGVAYYFMEYNESSGTSQAKQMSANEEHEALEQSTQEPEQQVVEEAPELPKVVLDEGGYAINASEVTEPTIVEDVLVANKKYPLPKDYNPGEDPEAIAALEEMKAAALQAGYNITAFSSFRSYDYQTKLYNNYVARDGKEKADRYSARPGYSEHQTGLAFDIGEVGQEDLWLTEAFGETPAGKWLAANANHYGFILRYPKDKETITGFMYESWHFRYLGQELATKVKGSGVTLEEYLGIE